MEPLAHQRYILDTGKKNKIVCAGRGSGKSTLLLFQALRHKKSAILLHPDLSVVDYVQRFQELGLEYTSINDAIFKNATISVDGKILYVTRDPKFLKFSSWDFVGVDEEPALFTRIVAEGALFAADTLSVAYTPSDSYKLENPNPALFSKYRVPSTIMPGFKDLYTELAPKQYAMEILAEVE